MKLLRYHHILRLYSMKAKPEEINTFSVEFTKA